MNIIVGASKPRRFKIGAALIMWWENTPASHAYTVMLTPNGKYMIFQAVGAGTQFLSYDAFLSHNIPVYEKEFQLDNTTFNALFDKMVDKLGVKYSVKHLAGLFYKRLIQYVSNGKLIIKNPFKDQGKSAICVEALLMVIDESKIKRDAEDPEDMGMFEALKLLRSLPGRELING